MDAVLSIGLQVGVFLAVVVGALAVVWRLEQGALIRRRMKGGTATASGRPAEEALLKPVRSASPLLSWVQKRMPAPGKDRPSPLARTLAEAGFPAPSAPALYALARIGSAVCLPLMLL
ncbi:MAG: hypothetical protein JF570_13345, partial [Caulobacter sp.]|nr:hypothetical protein [Caulobacter sp.]